MDGWVLPPEVLRDAPIHYLSARDLSDVELLLDGALAPLTGFPTRADLSSVAERGTLADGTPWSIPLTLEVPTQLVAGLDTASPLRRALVLVDAEGARVAAIDVVDTWITRTTANGSQLSHVAGVVRRLAPAPHRAFPHLRLSPAEVTAQLPSGRILAAIVDTPLHRPQLAQISYAAKSINGHVLIIIPIAEPGPDGSVPTSLIRCVLAARDRLASATIVTVPLRRHTDEVLAALMRSQIAKAYGATHLLVTPASMFGGGPHAVLPRRLAYDSRDGQWHDIDDIPVRNRRGPLSQAEIGEHLDRGVPLPEWHTPPAVARELVRARPPRRSRGVVVLFTGLSAAGKSSMARGLADQLAETGERSVTLIDGDAAHRYLGAGLGQSREERDGNVVRVGFVAAEAARHGGLVLCCQIAPSTASRSAARELATAAGAGFVLVHVSTPVEVCADRDPKGFYAKALDGRLSGMTGVDDPYEIPTDADISIDTSSLTMPQAVAQLATALARLGWLDRPID